MPTPSSVPRTASAIPHRPIPQSTIDAFRRGTPTGVLEFTARVAFAHSERTSGSLVADPRPACDEDAYEGYRGHGRAGEDGRDYRGNPAPRGGGSSKSSGGCDGEVNSDASPLISILILLSAAIVSTVAASPKPAPVVVISSLWPKASLNIALLLL